MFSHFTDGKTGTEELSNLPEVTVGKSRARKQVQGVWPHLSVRVSCAWRLRIWEGRPGCAGSSQRQLL